MNKLVDLLLNQDFDSFANACAADSDATLDDEVLAALQAMAAANAAIFEQLCTKLETETDVDVQALKEVVAGVGKKDKKKKGAKSQATLIANLAKEQSALLFHDEFGAAYACFNIGGHREIHKLKSKGFKLWLHRIYYERLHTVPGREAISAALGLLEAVALFDGPKHTVFRRRATVDGKLYIDICNDQWQAYEVDEQGWRVVSNPPVFFVRSPSMKPLPLAEHGGSKRNLRRLRKLLRVRDQKDFVVIVGFLLDALGGTGPYPVVNFNGEPGSTKTTHLKLIRSLIDPNAVPVRSPPRDVRDVYVVATKSAMVAYNNLSDLPVFLSDALCVVTEGSGDSRRELYTDDDESLIFACVPAMIAGVENVITRGDLADRTLYVGLAAVPENERIAEPEFWASVEKERPAILGALLNALVTGLKRLPTLELRTLPRMATFAKFVTACETEFWDEGTFLAAYLTNADSADVDVLEGDTAVSVLRTFMDDKIRWEGTATRLLDELVNIVKRPEREAEAEHAAAVAAAMAMGRKYDDDAARRAAILRAARDKVRETLGKGWPKKPHFLTGRLRKVGPQLRRAGIRIDWPAAHLRARIIAITNVAPHTYSESASSASSASSTETIIGGNAGFSNGKGSEREDAHEDAGGRSEDAVTI
jgi:hypothetical protein